MKKIRLQRIQSKCPKCPKIRLQRIQSKCPKCMHYSLKEVNDRTVLGLTQCRKAVMNKLETGVKCVLCGFTKTTMKIIDSKGNRLG